MSWLGGALAFTKDCFAWTGVVVGGVTALLLALSLDPWARSWIQLIGARSYGLKGYVYIEFKKGENSCQLTDRGQLFLLREQSNCHDIKLGDKLLAQSGAHFRAGPGISYGSYFTLEKRDCVIALEDKTLVQNGE